MSTNINEQAILAAIHRVPRERWGEVLQFLDSLQATGPTDPQSCRVLTGKDLAESDPIGIWADRTDIGHSREYAHRLRAQARQRTIQGRWDGP